MNRRAFLGCASAQAGLGTAPVPKAPAQGGNRPNVLWFTSDQQRFDTIAALGNRRIRTPNQDRLVSGGVAFTNNYCQNPVCTPSRASFLTGVYPSALHVNRNGNAYFPPEHTSKLLPRILASAGYDCGMVGKFHLSSAYQRVEPRSDDGYRLFEWSHAPRRDWPLAQHSYHRFVRGRGVDWAGVYRTQPYTAGWPKEFSPGMPTEVHEVTWCAEHAISFIKGALAVPWFISVNTYAPHPPHDPPREFLDRMDPASVVFPHFRPEDLAHQMSLSGIDHQTPRPIDMRRYP